MSTTVETLANATKALLNRTEAAESLNRELVAAAETLTFEIQSLEAFDGSVTPKVWAACDKLEAAINSATPKQGEGNK